MLTASFIIIPSYHIYRKYFLFFYFSSDIIICRYFSQPKIFISRKATDLQGDVKRQFYFVRAERDDDFGKATIIETAGGGVEEGEDLLTAVQRELKEELGVQADVICQIGVIEDYYNLIHRHNINNYFLCKVVTFGEKNLTPDEMKYFHLSTLKLSYEEAVQEYINRADTRLGKLVANRELPVLHRAKEILDTNL